MRRKVAVEVAAERLEGQTRLAAHALRILARVHQAEHVRIGLGLLCRLSRCGLRVRSQLLLGERIAWRVACVERGGGIPEHLLVRQRVLARPGMTEEKFAHILELQTPDSEKRARADHVIDTGSTLAQTEDAVRGLIAELRGKHPDGGSIVILL